MVQKMAITPLILVLYGLKALHNFGAENSSNIKINFNLASSSMGFAKPMLAKLVCQQCNVADGVNLCKRKKVHKPWFLIYILKFNVPVGWLVRWLVCPAFMRQRQHRSGRYMSNEPSWPRNEPGRSNFWIRPHPGGIKGAELPLKIKYQLDTFDFDET